MQNLATRDRRLIPPIGLAMKVNMIQVQIKIWFVAISLMIGFCAPAFASSLENAKPALVIIDMQDFFIENGGILSRENITKVNNLIWRQVFAIKEAKKNYVPIMLVEYEGCGSIDATILAAVDGYPLLKRILKDRDGLFDINNSSAVEAIEQLETWGTRDLAIMGANGSACVEATIVGALKIGYKIVVYDLGVADFTQLNFQYPYVYKVGQDSLPPVTPANFVQIDDASEFYHFLGSKTVYSER